jgi:hypothetical protein
LEINPPESHDATANDNSVAIASDALALTLWVQQGLHDWMQIDGRPGFERWAQREIERWNTILARST